MIAKGLCDGQRANAIVLEKKKRQDNSISKRISMHHLL